MKPVASNESVVADQDGEFDDWIELYNKSDQDVDLSGWYLSDNSDNFENIEFGWYNITCKGILDCLGRWRRKAEWISRKISNYLQVERIFICWIVHYTL